MTTRKRVLITGAAGKLGPILRRGLAAHFDLRLTDVVPIADASDMVVGDMNDPAVLDRAMAGVDAVVHLAAQSWGGDFEHDIVPRNIVGLYNIYEAAARNGVPRVVFSSSVRTVEGYNPLLPDELPVWRENLAHPVTLPITTLDPVRPDNLYGVSKVFGEALARMYADWRGVTSVCLRLGGVGPKSDESVATPRHWGIWMSDRDLVEAFRCGIEAEGIGCAIVFGCSANTRRWWDLERTRELIGFVAQDNSEDLVCDWYHGIAPAPPYPIPWGERLPLLPVDTGRARLVWIGQSGFFLKTPGGLKVAIDPFLSEWPDRLQPPFMPAADLPADVVLVTHAHRDHLDVHALPVVAQARPDARFVGPPTVCERLADLGIDAVRLTPLRPGDSLDLTDLRVTAMPARHQANVPDAIGYLLQADGVRIYHTGDTEYDDCLQAAQGAAIDLLLVPINGRGGNMTAEEAARLAADLRPRAVTPMHYGCLQPQADLLDRFLAELGRLAPAVTSAVMEVGAIVPVPLVFRPGPPPGREPA